MLRIDNVREEFLQEAGKRHFEKEADYQQLMNDLKDISNFESNLRE